jgi:adenosine deaminase
VQWIADLVRDFGADTCLELLNDLIAQDCRSLVGITLGGAEHRFPPEQFERVYATARDAGLRLTIHAGEALGPESVWNALELGVERIGHGVRSIEEPALVRHLAERRIPLEVCPTSNLRTGIYPSYSAHPLEALYVAGVPVTINSDDPTFFGTTLIDEYLHMHEAGIAQDDLYEMLKNGFRYAFLPQTEREKYLEELERAWATNFRLRPTPPMIPH